MLPVSDNGCAITLFLKLRFMLEPSTFGQVPNPASLLRQASPTWLPLHSTSTSFKRSQAPRPLPQPRSLEVRDLLPPRQLDFLWPHTHLQQLASPPNQNDAVTAVAKPLGSSQPGGYDIKLYLGTPDPSKSASDLPLVSLCTGLPGSAMCLSEHTAPFPFFLSS